MRAEKFGRIFIPEVNDVKILVVLRNQCDLIYSLYVDLHRLTKSTDKIGSIDDFIYSISTNQNRNYRGIYFYNALDAEGKIVATNKFVVSK